MRSYLSKKKGNFFHTNKKNERRRMFAAVGAAIIFFVFGAHFFGGVSSVIAQPFFAIHTWYDTSAHALPTYIRGINALRTENDALRADVERLMVGGAQHTYEALHASSTMELASGRESGLLAGVYAAPPMVPYDILILDKGARDGVEVGSVVYHVDDRAIGIIQKVYEATALMSLFSTPKLETSVYLAEAKLFTVATGRGGGVVAVRVPQDVPVEKGNLVLLPGLANGYLGTIDHINENPTDPEKHAFVSVSAPQAYRVVRIAPKQTHIPSAEEIYEFLDTTTLEEYSIEPPHDTGTTTETTATETPEEPAESTATEGAPSEATE